MPYYGVKVGRIVGVFSSWLECENSVKGFAGAKYKKFGSYDDARNFVGGGCQETGEISKKRRLDENVESVTAETSEDNTSETCKAPKTDIQGELPMLTFYHDATDPKRVLVYTDGSCKGPINHRHAGYGIYWGPDHPWNVAERLEGEQTNNRAEIEAVITAAHQARNAGITHLGIITDSKFTQQCATEWGPRWAKNSWKLASGENAKLQDAVKRLLEATTKPDLNITWYHVRGHRGNRGNEEADLLANKGAEKHLSNGTQ